VWHLLVGILQSAIRTVMPSVSESSSSCMLTASAPSSSGSPNPFCWRIVWGGRLVFGAQLLHVHRDKTGDGVQDMRGRIVRHLRSRLTLKNPLMVDAFMIVPSDLAGDPRIPSHAGARPLDDFR
jgi:hypothetical protein